jgi:hypothetical protein
MAMRLPPARHLLVTASLLLLGACHRASTPAGGAAAPFIPRDAARFEIDVVDDSTAQFRPKETRWIRLGMPAYVVDPTRRDALVARLRLEWTDGETMTALVTSQVTRVTTSHFLLVPRPAVPWWKAYRFWLGVAAGGAIGASATAATISR